MHVEYQMLLAGLCRGMKIMYKVLFPSQTSFETHWGDRMNRNKTK